MKRLSICLSGILLGICGPAAASPTYPGLVEGALDLSSAPACTLCHQSSAGGQGTATKPVAFTLLRFGLSGGSNSSALLDAIAELETKESDSDEDGVSDVDELSDGTDPNVDTSENSDPAPEAGPDATPDDDDDDLDADSGGCHLSPGTSGSGPALLLLLGALGLARIRRERHSRN